MKTEVARPVPRPHLLPESAFVAYPNPYLFLNHNGFLLSLGCLYPLWLPLSTRRTICLGLIILN